MKQSSQLIHQSYLAAFLGTNSLSVLMCHKAVNHSINLERGCGFFHVLWQLVPSWDDLATEEVLPDRCVALGN